MRIFHLVAALLLAAILICALAAKAGWPTPQGAPALNSIAPAVVNPGVTVKLTIDGASFVPGQTTINFVDGTGVTATNINHIGATRFTADFVVTPSASRGQHRITVNTPAGSSRPAVFEVLDAPVLTGITPARGSENTQVTVTLTGAFFHPDSQLELAGAGVTITNLERMNDTMLNATFTIAPGARSGPRHVAVRNRAGSSSALVFNVDGGAGKS